ncbi:hypothetical protein GMSM_19110 [Geomonas sp. Red276]
MKNITLKAARARISPEKGSMRFLLPSSLMVTPFARPWFVLQGDAGRVAAKTGEAATRQFRMREELSFPEPSRKQIARYTL